jgi:hypothetical protein
MIPATEQNPLASKGFLRRQGKNETHEERVDKAFK